MINGFNKVEGIKQIEIYLKRNFMEHYVLNKFNTLEGMYLN